MPFLAYKELFYGVKFIFLAQKLISCLRQKDKFPKIVTDRFSRRHAQFIRCNFWAS